MAGVENGSGSNELHRTHGDDGGSFCHRDNQSITIAHRSISPFLGSQGVGRPLTTLPQP